MTETINPPYSFLPVDLVQPLLNVVERLLVRHVVHDDNTVGSPVVRRRNRAEPFLARGVPLQKTTKNVDNYGVTVPFVSTREGAQRNKVRSYVLVKP